MPGQRIFIFAALMALAAASAGADPVPASVRACIGLADAGQRLACYDREVARLIAPADTFAQTPGSAAPVVPPSASTQGMPVPSAIPRPSAGPAPAQAPIPSLPVAAPAAKHLTAKVGTAHQSGDRLVVTLDNGDVWEQTNTAATSQLNVKPGDVVQLDHELGGWFLSNRYGDSIQVKLRQP